MRKSTESAIHDARYVARRQFRIVDFLLTGVERPGFSRANAIRSLLRTAVYMVDFSEGPDKSTRSF